MWTRDPVSRLATATTARLLTDAPRESPWRTPRGSLRGTMLVRPAWPYVRASTSTTWPAVVRVRSEVRSTWPGPSLPSKRPPPHPELPRLCPRRRVWPRRPPRRLNAAGGRRSSRSSGWSPAPASVKPLPFTLPRCPPSPPSWHRRRRRELIVMARRHHRQKARTGCMGRRSWPGALPAWLRGAARRPTCALPFPPSLLINRSRRRQVVVARGHAADDPLADDSTGPAAVQGLVELRRRLDA